MRIQILIFIFLLHSPQSWAFPKKIQSAKNYFLNKNYRQARKELNHLSSDQLNSKETALVSFFQGLISFEQKDYSSAVDFFSRSLNQDPYLREVAYYYLALSHLRLNQYRLAKKFFKKADHPDSSEFIRNRARFHLGEFFFQGKNYRLAGNIFEKLEKKMRRTDLHPDILWFLLKINRKKGRRKRVCQLSRLLYFRYPHFEPIAHWELKWEKNLLDGRKLNCKNKVKDQMRRIKRLQWMGLNEKALKEINHFKNLEKDPFIKDIVIAQYLSSEGMFRKAFDLLSPHYRGKKRQKNEDYIKLFAKISEHSGQYKKALSIYLKAYENFPRSKKPDFLFRAAFLSYQFKDYNKALQLFNKLQTRHSHSFSAKKTLWYIPWIHYLKKDYQKSFDMMSKTLETSPRGISEKRLRYWMAMSLKRLGSEESAQKLFLKNSQDESMGYYSIASVQRLRETLTPKSLAKFNFSESFVLRENWLTQKGSHHLTPLQTKMEEGSFSAQWEDLPFMKEYMALNQNDQDHPSTVMDESQFKKSLERARSLSLIGLTELAKWELYKVEKKTKNKEFLKNLMFEYYRNKLFHRSAFIGSQHFEKTRTHLGLHLGATLWQFVYPRAFEEEVLKNGKKFGVSPEFIWSIMKAETNFRPDVQSPVGAKGLMQIMTHTGRKVAGLMGKEIRGPELFDPSVGVEIGTRYLQRVLKKFDNKIPLAAAAYNGGPHRVHRWLQQFGNLEMDEFIEHIPFRETRRYVKKVTRYYTLYHLLYNKNTQASSWLADNVNVYPEGTAPTRETWETL